MRLRPEQKTAALGAVAHLTGEIVAMRAGGGVALDPAKRATLLAAAVAREDVELELDILAYEQKTGERNLNNFRFRDGAMMSLGRTGKGTPFLRDHRQRDTEAVGGTVIESRTEKVAEGHYKIFQTVSLREPKAVERALRGLMHAVSIGAYPTGPVECSHCGTEVFEDCWHYPGQEVELEGGDRHVIEWIYSAAVLKETSECPIGAVPTAGPQSIRAGIEAAIGAALEDAPDQSKRKEPMSKLSPAALAKLGLAATASEDEVTAAVEKLSLGAAEADKAKKDLAVLQLEQKLDGSTPIDLFIKAGYAAGKINQADEPVFRELFELAPAKARAKMDERPAGFRTPVGAERQSDAKDAADAEVKAAATGGDSKVAKRDAEATKVLKANNVDPAAAARFAKAFGAKDPMAAIAKHACGVEEN